MVKYCHDIQQSKPGNISAILREVTSNSSQQAKREQKGLVKREKKGQTNLVFLKVNLNIPKRPNNQL